MPPKPIKKLKDLQIVTELLDKESLSKGCWSSWHGVWAGAGQKLVSGLSSNQGEKSINLCFIMVPLRRKVLKYGTPKPSRA